MDGFSKWLEQFNMVATACRWSEQTRLVNLIMRSAYSFYRTCSPDQRSNFSKITEELKGRFTPVRIPVVESNLFHERRQRSNESVDVYAQELKQLFYKAYPRAQQSTREAEQMGQNVLSCQFLAGLVPGIKEKLVGSEGDFNMLLVKARFDEAKKRDLQSTSPSTSAATHSRSATPKPFSGTTDKRGANPTRRPPGGGIIKPSNDCFNCGLRGHLARDCRYRGRAAPVESRGSTRSRETTANNGTSRQVANVSTQDGDNKDDRVRDLRKELGIAELEKALKDVRGTLHHVIRQGKTQQKRK